MFSVLIFDEADFVIISGMCKIEWFRIMQMPFVLRDYCVTELQGSAIKIANEPHVFFSHLVLVVEFNFVLK